MGSGHYHGVQPWVGPSGHREKGWVLAEGRREEKGRQGTGRLEGERALLHILPCVQEEGTR